MSLDEFDIWYQKKRRRTSSAFTSTVFVISDLLAVMLSFAWGFFWVRIYCYINPFYSINAKSFITYWPYLPVFLIIFKFFQLYPGISLAPSEELRRFSLSSFLVYGGILISRYINNYNWDSINTAFVISCIFSTVILLIARNITHSFLHAANLNGIPAVIYGSSGTGRLVVKCLLTNKKSGYVPVLILDDNLSGEDKYMDIPIIHDTLIGNEIVKRYNIKMAIVAMPKLSPQELTDIINASVSAFRYNVVIPNYHNITTIWMSVRDFSGILGIDTSNKLKLTWNLTIKRILDLTIVITGGMLILPFLLLTALIIKLSSPGPVLFKQKRIGKDGKEFIFYKFRSMAADAEKQLQEIIVKNTDLKDEWSKTHKLLNDPRITGFGKILRRTSIDEIPQLINIIKGDMSLVGPRPIVEEEIQKYGKDFNRVFSNKPGLTGLWQVSGRSDAEYHDRISFDTYYLQNWSIWLDLWIIYRTFGVVIFGKGAY
jgi:Undecaprenyl-phosphate galactose phosphotransferase WbaP